MVEMSVSDEKLNLTCIVLSLLLGFTRLFNLLPVRAQHNYRVRADLVHRKITPRYHCYHSLCFLLSKFVNSVLLGSRRKPVYVLSEAR